jgi:hypothetical protein
MGTAIQSSRASKPHSTVVHDDQLVGPLWACPSDVPYDRTRTRALSRDFSGSLGHGTRTEAFPITWWVSIDLEGRDVWISYAVWFHPFTLSSDVVENRQDNRGEGTPMPKPDECCSTDGGVIVGWVIVV